MVENSGNVFLASLIFSDAFGMRKLYATSSGMIIPESSYYLCLNNTNNMNEVSIKVSPNFEYF